MRDHTDPVINEGCRGVSATEWRDDREMGRTTSTDMAFGVTRLCYIPVEWSRQHGALGLNP